MAVCGSVDLRGDDFEQLGVAAATSIMPEPMTIEQAIARAADLTSDAAERLARAIRVSV